MSSVDLTPQARIRAAAIELFGSAGFDRTTVRAIATNAGVSPALIIHHFGSKEGLREACDEWVMSALSAEKTLVMAGGSLPELQAYLADHPEMAPVADYLATSLRAGGPLAERVFDRLCAMTAEVMEAGYAAGTMRRPPDPEAAVPMLVAYSAGVGLLGQHVARHLGGANLMDPQVYSRYGLASLDLFTHGMFTDDHLLRGALGDHDEASHAIDRTAPIDGSR